MNKILIWCCYSLFVAVSCVDAQEFPKAMGQRRFVDREYHLEILAGNSPLVAKSQIEKVLQTNGLSCATANLLPLLFTDLNGSLLEDYTKSKLPGVRIAAAWQSVLLSSSAFPIDDEQEHPSIERFLDVLTQETRVDIPPNWRINVKKLDFNGGSPYFPLSLESDLTVNPMNQKLLQQQWELPNGLPLGSRCQILRTANVSIILWTEERNGDPVLKLGYRRGGVRWNREIEHSWNLIFPYPSGNAFLTLDDKTRNAVVFFCFPDRIGVDVREGDTGQSVLSFNTAWPRLLN